MNIQELIETKRVQEAFVEKFAVTPDDKLNPKQFTNRFIKHWIKDITEAHEDDKAIKEAMAVINSKKQELIV